MLLTRRNGFKQQTQSSRSLLSPQDHMVIFKCYLYSLLKTHLILYAYNIPNVFLLLVVHSIPYSHKTKIQLPENKKQVTFTTNNSPHWGLTVACFGIRSLAVFPVPLPSNSKTEDVEPPALARQKLQHQERQHEQTVQRHFSHVLPRDQSVLGGHIHTKGS